MQNLRRQGEPRLRAAPGPLAGRGVGKSPTTGSANSAAAGPDGADARAPQMVVKVMPRNDPTRVKPKRTKGMRFSAKRLAGEIIMQASLRHPKIVQLYGVVLSRTHIGVLLEPVLGGELAEYLAAYPSGPGAPGPFSEMDGRLLQVRTRALPKHLQKGHPQAISAMLVHPKAEYVDEARARYFFRQIVESIEHCHSQHIAHRDMKLTNILLDRSLPPNLKLCDFGLAQHFFGELGAGADDDSDDGGAAAFGSMQDAAARGEGPPPQEGPPAPEPAPEAAGKPDRTFARCNTRVGTPNYVPLEIARKSMCRDGYDGTAADIWSMGVVLFYMLCGKFPFPDLDGHLTLIKTMKNNYRVAMLQFMMTERGLSKDVQDLVVRMLDLSGARIGVAEIKAHPWYAAPVEDPARAFQHLHRAEPPLKSAYKALKTGFKKLLGVPDKKRLGHHQEHHAKAVASAKAGGKSGAEAAEEAADRSAKSLDRYFSTARSLDTFPEASWGALRELIDEAAAGLGRAHGDLQVWSPTHDPFRLTRRLDGGDVDYRFDLPSHT